MLLVKDEIHAGIKGRKTDFLKQNKTSKKRKKQNQDHWLPTWKKQDTQFPQCRNIKTIQVVKKLIIEKEN